MPRFVKSVNNFSSGKVSEKFKGRFDTQEYQNSVEDLKNFYIHRTGGAFKRNGSVVAFNTALLSNLVNDNYQMVPFDSGSGLSYVVLLPNTPVTMSISPIYIYVNNPSSVTLYKTPSSNGISLNTKYASQPNWTPSVATLVGTWKYCQVGDFLFLTHSSGNQRPLVLARTSNSTFELQYYDQAKTGTALLNEILRVPYTDNNVANITLDYDSSGVDDLITSSVDYFEDGMEGSLLRLDGSTVSKVVVITEVVSAQSVKFNDLFDTMSFASVAPTTAFRISMWNNYFGWPTSVTYFQQKLFWGGTPFRNYERVWGSLTGNLFHMMADRLLQDDGSDASGINYFGDATVIDPTSFVPASQESNAIKWLHGGRVLTVGTSGGEYIVSGFDGSIDLKQNSNYGSSGIQPQSVGKDIVFVGKDLKTVRTYRYSDDNGSWVSDDLNAKSDTIFEGGSNKQITWDSDNKILYALYNNKLYFLTYDPQYGINAWSEFELGGYVDPIGGKDSVLSDKVIGITTLPSVDRAGDEIFLLVKRKVGGNTFRFVERIVNTYTNETIAPDLDVASNISKYPRFLDFAIRQTADGSGVIDVGDVDKIGMTFDVSWFDSNGFNYALDVEVISDGATGAVFDLTVPAGAYVLYGYKYDAEIKTLPPETGGSFGATSLGDIKDIDRVYFILYRTKDFSVGSFLSESKQELPFEDITFDDLTSKNQDVFLDDVPDLEGQFIVRSDKPTPLNILAMVVKGLTEN